MIENDSYKSESFLKKINNKLKSPSVDTAKVAIASTFGTSAAWEAAQSSGVGDKLLLGAFAVNMGYVVFEKVKKANKK